MSGTSRTTAITFDHKFERAMELKYQYDGNASPSKTPPGVFDYHFDHEDRPGASATALNNKRKVAK
jgi:hypothetical protein